jgi:hypothetical protein
MHLQIRKDETLATLDDFLRYIWLECCGHLSEFRIGEREFLSDVDEEWGDEAEEMNVALGDVLRPGRKFAHRYDFGTSTELVLTVVAEREGNLSRRRPVRVLARNTPPTIPCVSCGSEAKQVCSQCVWEDKGWLCSKCAGKHECGEGMLLPVVNSPRVGMCGYTG